jgi:uncharacterized sporulation protein YeaH/YhbH (DUF444 family)
VVFELPHRPPADWRIFQDSEQGAPAKVYLQRMPRKTARGNAMKEREELEAELASEQRWASDYMIQAEKLRAMLREIVHKYDSRTLMASSIEKARGMI